MLPAPGQGAIAIESRNDDRRIEPIAAALNHPATSIAVAAERTFLERMGGGCNVPVAVYARLSGNCAEIDGLVAATDGSRIVRASNRGSPGPPMKQLSILQRIYSGAAAARSSIRCARILSENQESLQASEFQRIGHLSRNKLKDAFNPLAEGPNMSAESGKLLQNLTILVACSAKKNG